MEQIIICDEMIRRQHQQNRFWSAANAFKSGKRYAGAVFLQRVLR